MILESGNVGVLRSRLEDVIVNHAIGYRLETLAGAGLIDAVIVDTEDGFSQLGSMRTFLSTDLGLHERNVARWALNGFPEKLERSIASLSDWNRARDPEVTLVAIPSERRGSLLRGAILAPYDGSACYTHFATPEYDRPHHDFMYNVTYEAIAYAYRVWNARRIGITHLSRAKYAGKYHRDVTTCQIEAMVHFCGEHRGMESFTFLDDSVGNVPLELVKEFNERTDIGAHRPSRISELEFWGLTFVDLDFSKAS